MQLAIVESSDQVKNMFYNLPDQRSVKYKNKKDMQRSNGVYPFASCNPLESFWLWEGDCSKHEMTAIKQRIRMNNLLYKQYFVYFWHADLKVLEVARLY